MKQIILSCFLAIYCTSLFAQDTPHENYLQWPADKPETESIEQSQSRQVRLDNHSYPQIIEMQDAMRALITSMMENAARILHWPMVELTEYASDAVLYTNPQNIIDFAPYPLCPPAAFNITFQFIVNNNSLQAWKTYETNYQNNHLATQQNNYSNMQSAMQSPLYKRYKDSADHYMKLYLQYIEAHKNEGAALYTKDKHPKYYQRKENEFINKMTGITDGIHDNSGIEQAEDEHDLKTYQFRNSTVVQVEFCVNNSMGMAIDQSRGTIESTSVVYPLQISKLSRIYTFSKKQTNESLVKWNNVILILLGNFLTRLNDYGGYDAGFNHNSQGDNHTPKKIKTDKVQNISVNILGNRTNTERIAKLIDVNKLNSTIVKQ